MKRRAARKPSARAAFETVKAQSPRSKGAITNVPIHDLHPYGDTQTVVLRIMRQKCCADCNDNVVIPARLAEFHAWLKRSNSHAAR